MFSHIRIVVCYKMFKLLCKAKKTLNSFTIVRHAEIFNSIYILCHINFIDMPYSASPLRAEVSFLIPSPISLAWLIRYPTDSELNIVLQWRGELVFS